MIDQRYINPLMYEDVEYLPWMLAGSNGHLHNGPLLRSHLIPPIWVQIPNPEMKSTYL